MEQSRGQSDEASLCPREEIQKDLPIYKDGDYAVVTKKSYAANLKMLIHVHKMNQNFEFKIFANNP